jgi:predicted nucleic acid-binding protein
VVEPESAALQDLVRGRSLASSRVAVVEVTKAVARVNPTADPEPLLSRVAFVEFDADLARIAGATGGPRLRALDAIHIASALRLGAELETFLTYDQRQARSAREAGLRLAAPGSARRIDEPEISGG